MKATILFAVLIIIGYYVYQEVIGLEVKVGIPQKSSSIKLSKKNGVFIKKYNADSDTILINENKYILAEIWAESKWFYKNTSKEIDKYDGYQLILKFHNELNLFAKDSQRIFIKHEKKRYPGLSRNCLKFQVDSILDHHTIHVVSSELDTFKFGVFPDE